MALSRNEIAKRYRDRHKEQIKSYTEKYRQSSKGRYALYLRYYEKNPGEYALTQAEYDRIISAPCFYCGKELNKKGHGLDRVNSELGYDKTNVVGCCSMCNRIKNKFSVEELKTHLPKMLKGLGKL